jgi:hypothetical protein
MGFTGSCIVTTNLQANRMAEPSRRKGRAATTVDNTFAIHRKMRTIHVVSQCSLDLSAAFPVAETHD